MKNNIKIKYLLQFPKDYYPSQETKHPLILFLHGAGERGNDLEELKQHGIPKIAEEHIDFPFIAVSPQCPKNSNWNELSEKVFEMLNEIISKYKIDEDRIYLTGISMGGFGTWNLATLYPDKFAAIVPICGGGNTSLAYRLKNLPIWVFHGAKDNIVPINYSEEMVKKVREYNPEVIFTIYPNTGHDSWTQTYNNPELYKWLLNHKRDHSN